MIKALVNIVTGLFIKVPVLVGTIREERTTQEVKDFLNRYPELLNKPIEQTQILTVEEGQFIHCFEENMEVVWICCIMRTESALLRECEGDETVSMSFEEWETEALDIRKRHQDFIN